MIPGLASEYRAMIADLANSLTNVSVPRARAELRKLVGEIQVKETEDEIQLCSSQSPEEALFGSSEGQSKFVW